MKKLFLLMTALLLIIGMVSMAQAVPILQLGDVAFKLHDVTYFDDPLLAPGQDPVPGGTGSGRSWGIANITSIHTLMGGNVENPILSSAPIWTPTAGADYLQVRFGGIIQSYTNPPGPGFPGFPYDAYMTTDVAPYVSTTTNNAGNAYLEIYSLNTDAFAADYVDGPLADNVGELDGEYGTFGTAIAAGNLWLELAIQDGVLPFYDAMAGYGPDLLPNTGDEVPVIEKSTASTLTTGGALMYSTIVGGTAAGDFITGVFPLFDPTWGTGADPDPTHHRADIRMKINLTAMYDDTLDPGDKWYDLYGWSLDSQDPVTGTTIPEPATMLLLGSGLLGMAGFVRKKRFKK